MAQSSDLLAFLKEDEKLHKFLAAIWEKRYGKNLAAAFKIPDGPGKIILKNIIAQNHADAVVAHKIFAQNKGMGQAFGGILDLITEFGAKIFAAAE